jgi:hypothetical protein
MVLDSNNQPLDELVSRHIMGAIQERMDGYPKPLKELFSPLFN